MTALFATTGADATPLGTATITAIDNMLTLTTHGLTDGQQVAITTPTGGATGVLVIDAPYFVASATANTFQLRPSPGGPVMDFIADGGADVDLAGAVYTGQALRQGFGGLMYKSRENTPDIGRFGSRPGVILNGTSNEVSVAALTVTVTDLNCVINPATGGTQGGPYLCAIPTGQHNLAAADGTNPRIDTLIAEVLDTAEDASGLIVARTRVITGTPAAIPVAPSAPVGTLELAQFTIPALSGAATMEVTALYTVAAGGIVPVRDAVEQPSAVRREGMYIDNADTDALLRWDGSAWAPVGNSKGFQHWKTIRYTASSSFVKADHVGARMVRVKLVGGGGAGAGCDITGVDQAASGGGGGGGCYAESELLVGSLASSVTVTVGVGATSVANANGATGGTTSFGALVIGPGGSGGFNVGPSGTPRATSGAFATGGGTGDIVIPGSGGSGSTTFNGTIAASEYGHYGFGGGSHLGAATRGARGPSTAPENGQLYGGGGSGVVNGPSTAGRAGGNGASGICIVEVYV